MTDLRKAAEMALHALEFSLPAIEDFGSKEQLTDCHRAIMALYKALAQPEQEKESTAQTVDPRLLLGRSNNFTKETENRLCDIERRLAAIETQPALAHDRACEVMRGLNNAELSQMTLLRAFAMGYRDANMMGQA